MPRERPRVVSFRLTDAEYERLSSECVGSLSEHLRSLVLRAEGREDGLRRTGKKEAGDA